MIKDEEYLDFCKKSKPKLKKNYSNKNADARLRREKIIVFLPNTICLQIGPQNLIAVLHSQS